MQLHPEVDALLHAMRDLERLLVQNGEAFWSTQIKRAADEVEKSDAHGLERFLGMFGGMGSLNDLVLAQDGRTNDQLDRVRRRAWTIAHALRRETG